MDAKTRPFLCWPEQSNNASSDFEVDGVGLESLHKAAPGAKFVTSLNAVKQRAETYVESLANHFPLSKIFYAMKANAAPAILREVTKVGCGVDIVSVGEFRAAVAAGVSPRDICFAGVGKSNAEIIEALDGQLGVINVEHAQELTFVLQTLAQRQQKSLSEGNRFLARVAVRLNPCVESQTHPHLKTGALDSKFGLLLAQLEEWIATTKASFTEHGQFDTEKYKVFVAPLCGLHVHIGSQLQSHDVFPLVLERVQQAVVLLAQADIVIDHLDLGGGLGVGPAGVPEDANDIRKHVDFQAECLKSLVQKDAQLTGLWGSNCEKLHVCLEPGRSMVASSTVFLTEVLYEKSNMPSHRFAYVDAGMNAFPRPSIYGAEHATACANRTGGEKFAYKIFGPVCESGDILAREANLPRLVPGDTVVFFEAGAYCRSMASHYNLRGIPAEIFVRNGQIEALVPADDPTAHLLASASGTGLHADSFTQVVESRRSVRKFHESLQIPEHVMQRCLDHALLAPSSSNLQMWEFFWVRTAEKKKSLVRACLSQPAAATAAELVVCVARTDTWKANRLRMLDLLRKNPKTPAAALNYYEKLIPLALNQGPLAFFGLLKTCLTSVAGVFRATPREPASTADMRVWAVKSTALACENLMLSLRAHGFDSCPMEGFDSRRVKKLLGLPRRGAEVVMVVGAGARTPQGIYGPRIRFDRRFYINEV